MKCNLIVMMLMLMVGLAPSTTFAQTNNVISGTIKNATTKEVVPAVSVTIKGTAIGTYTDDNGKFKFTTTQKLPVTLIISSIGYANKEVKYDGAGLDIELSPSYQLGQEVVVAASRVAEKYIESPVSVERMSAASVRNQAAPSFYEGLANLKGVDMVTSSFNFRTVSTRGFNGSGNLRFNQLLDGMDNQAPGLNFSVGNIIGAVETDIENVELLSGASSALYGSGGTNGTLIMTSKNPFKYQGFSFIIKQGANHIDNAQRSTAPVYDWSFRWAKKLSEKFAFKISGQLTQVQDWQATDRSNLLRNNVLSTPKAGDRMSDPNYDGVNVFGDEASASMLALAQAVRFQVGATPQGAGAIGAIDNLLNAGTNPGLVFNNPAFAALRPFMPFIIGSNRTVNYFGSQLVSRTGYDERDLVDYNAYNVKLNGGLYYKITDNVEASLVAYYGMGTTVYTGSDRYSIKNLRLGQYKLEIKGKNWFVRGYTTQENSGDAYTATTAALAVNNAWKSNTTWFQQYVGTYAGARLQGLADGQAHGAARAAADQGRFLPGTEQFKNAFNAAVNTSIGTPGKDGAKFADNTSLYHYEGQYNLTEALKFAEVLVGASYRTFRLNSNGTIFADTTGPININEVGGYLQMSKKLFNDAVKLTGSVRYDKNQNFEGRFTPRLSATFKVAQDNNFRVSYQTGYRFPSTQDQYINLATPGSRLIGGMPSFNTFFNFNNSPGYTAESVAAFRAAVGSNLTPAGIGAAVPLLRQVQFSPLRPEQVKSFEIGYRGLITKSLLIDGYFYTSRYSDFIARVAVARGSSALPATNPNSYAELVSPFTTTSYSFVTNTSTPVDARGWGLSAEYQAGKGYVVSGNVSGDQIYNVPANVVTFFNTPKLRFNVSLANNNFYKNWGFNIIYRWQDAINWEGTFGTGEIPSFGVVDAQVNYRFPNTKNMLKIGGTNIFNNYYRSAFGNPQIGGLYYVSFGYNVF